jgi:hypothetical protein
MLGDTVSTRRDLVSQLKQGSPFLESQKEDFWNLWDSLKKPEIFSFFETVKTATVKEV